MYDQIERQASGEPNYKPCLAGRVSAVIYEDGRLAPCEILPDVIGNLKDVDYQFSKLWESEGRAHCASGSGPSGAPAPGNAKSGPTSSSRRRSTRSSRRRPSFVELPPRRRGRSIPTLRPLRFAILIPAHDEERSIERKIEATHGMRFEKREDGLPHLAIVIDDHSSDGTLGLARSAVASLAPRHDLEWRVIENHGSPGKGTALRTGFEEAAGFDVLAITDVDAMVSAEAPALTARALRNPKVGAVTGTQQYVAEIGAGGFVGNRLDAFDRASEAVRRFESLAGACFSVHGPWLAVRASTGAKPVPGSPPTTSTWRSRSAARARAWCSSPRRPSGR